MKRRSFLEGTLLGGALLMSLDSSLLKVAEATSAASKKDAFGARSEADVLRALFGDMKVTPSEQVSVVAPKQAMLGKGVSVKVWCDVEGAEMIAIVTRNNRHPLNTLIHLISAEGYYSTRIRVERTSPVSAHVRVGGRLYSASTNIKVSRGGYGMHVD